MTIFICLVSAFFWAGFDITRKLSLKKISSTTLLFLFSLGQLLIFLMWIYFESFSINIKPYLLPAIVLIFIGVSSALLFLKAINQSELSLTIPLLSLSPMFSSVFSYIFIDEVLLKTQYLGIFAIVLGTLILYSKELTAKDFLNSWKVITKNKSARIMICVSLMWSITPVLDKICLKYSSINIHGFIQSVGIIFFLLFLLIKNTKNEILKIRNHWKIILLTVLIGVIATILQFFAILNNFVPIMESIKRSVGQLSSIVFGNFFFKEKITESKIIGVLTLSTGIYLII
mgnify:FL=1